MIARANFEKLKREVKVEVMVVIKEMKSLYHNFVKNIQCDNVGENSACVVEELGITFMYTAPVTLQYSGTVGQSFSTFYGQAQAMMNHTNFSHLQEIDYGQMWSNSN